MQIYDEHGALIPLSTDGDSAGVYLHQGATEAEGWLGGYAMQPYLAQEQQDYLHAGHEAVFPVRPSGWRPDMKEGEGCWFAMVCIQRND